MEFILSLVIESIEQVYLTLQHNWLFLALSVVIAALLKLYVNAEMVSTFLRRHQRAGVVAATTAAVATPLCSCGTTAVVLGMMASSLPWAPIVAFMVASPLTSPEGLVYSAGLFGWPFALAFYLGSILLGLSGGWAAAALERRGWLANQVRFSEDGPVACACPSGIQSSDTDGRVFSLETPIIQLSVPGPASCCAIALPFQPAADCGCDQPSVGCACPATVSAAAGESPLGVCSDLPVAVDASSTDISPAPGRQVTLGAFLKELFVGGKHLLVMFLGFAFIGYFLNGLIPAGWVGALFGGDHIYNVPLAATLGLPFYINSEASLPLVRGLLDAGMSQGAALAFLIAGAGTSIGAITGALTIARWRVVALVVGVLWLGAILSGLAFDLAMIWMGR
jgi:uncharacterized membrane protein YraQ (UPF0718 family)